jgi:hypothetical protein
MYCYRDSFTFILYHYIYQSRYSIFISWIQNKYEVTELQVNVKMNLYKMDPFQT